MIDYDRRVRFSTYLVFFWAGVSAAFIFVALMYIVAPDSMMPQNFTCVAASKDGCMVFFDNERAERYQRGEAGT